MQSPQNPDLNPAPELGLPPDLNLPEVALQKSHLAEGVSLAELLVLTGLAVNREAARKLITLGETSIDDRLIDNAMERVRLSDGAIRIAAGAAQVLLRAV
ncbi:hypothetical protein [Ferrovibrio sp.]|jgi:tyrosyl-tRNA synthetase|uniref:hypothetical protein n=1 Tax=Ferrovibrio sp. TaxID=1917215 RepID=UPI0035B18E3B